MFDFPEPLFESALASPALCLVCASRRADRVLRTTQAPIVPVCAECAAAWNAYGYQVLKRIRPWPLIRRILWFKLRNPFQAPSLRAVFRHVQAFKAWATKMRRWTR